MSGNEMPMATEIFGYMLGRTRSKGDVASSVGDIPPVGSTGCSDPFGGDVMVTGWLSVCPVTSLMVSVAHFGYGLVIMTGWEKDLNFHS